MPSSSLVWKRLVPPGFMTSPPRPTSVHHHHPITNYYCSQRDGLCRKYQYWTNDHPRALTDLGGGGAFRFFLAGAAAAAAPPPLANAAVVLVESRKGLTPGTAGPLSAAENPPSRWACGGVLPVLTITTPPEVEVAAVASSAGAAPAAAPDVLPVAASPSPPRVRSMACDGDDVIAERFIHPRFHEFSWRCLSTQAVQPASILRLRLRTRLAA